MQGNGLLAIRGSKEDKMIEAMGYGVCAATSRIYTNKKNDIGDDRRS